MSLLTTRKDRDALLKIHALSLGKVSFDDTDTILTQLLLQIGTDYAEGKSSFLPRIGEVVIDYVGETVDDGKAEAKLTVTITPSVLFKKMIGQIHDKTVPTIIEENLMEYIMKELEAKLES